MNGLKSFGRYPTSGGPCRTRTCDLYPFRLSDGIRPVPWSIYTALKDGMLRVGSGFPGACLWSSPKLYDHGFTAGALFFPDGYSYSLPVLPHERCDPPALMYGLVFTLRHMPRGGRRRPPTTPGESRRKERRWGHGISSHTPIFA